MSCLRFLYAAIILSALCLSPLASTAHAAGNTSSVSGRVVYMGEPLEGALVYAYKEPDRLFLKPAEATPQASDKDGRFTIALPKGNYFIAAMKKMGPGKADAPEGGDLYSFYGGNPVFADPARQADITLNMVEKPEAAPDAETGGDKGGVEGAVTFNGAPLDGVVLYVYLDTKDLFRGMGYYMSPPTGVDGAYKMKMSEGTYYILARKRMGGMLAGPLHEGDYFGYLDINPVVVHKGRTVHADIPLVKKVEKAAPGGQGRSLLRGVIKDGSGRPVSGMYACIYRGKDMLNRPAYISRPTGPDGVFELEVPVGGLYYLAARNAIGGPLDPGQLWGRYDGSVDHSVVVETGNTVEGLQVTVDTVE